MMLKNMEHFLFVDPHVETIERQGRKGPTVIKILAPAHKPKIEEGKLISNEDTLIFEIQNDENIEGHFGTDKDIEVLFDEHYYMDMATLLAEDMKRFSPILVRYNDYYLRQVSFYRQNGQHTLNKTEEIKIKTDDGIFHTTYSDIRIESFSDKVEEIKKIDDGSKFSETKFRAIGDVSKGDLLEIQYKLRDSFCVINREGIFEIQIFTDYDDLEVIYETNMETPFYKADRVKLPNDVRDYLNINPHFNDYSSGFLFIADQEYPVREIDLPYEEPELDVRCGVEQDNTIFKVKLKDKFGNPVYTQAEVSAKKGTIAFYDNGTDERIKDPESDLYGSSDIYGNIYIKYTPPIGDDTEVIEDTLTIEADGTTKEIPIKLNYTDDMDDILSATISIAFPYHEEALITDNEILATEIFVGNIQTKPLEGKEVTVRYKRYSDDTVLEEVNLTSGNNGRAIHYYKPDVKLTRGEVRRCYVEAEHDDQIVIQNFKLIGVAHKGG